MDGTVYWFSSVENRRKKLMEVRLRADVELKKTRPNRPNLRAQYAKARRAKPATGGDHEPVKV